MLVKAIRLSICSLRLRLVSGGACTALISTQMALLRFREAPVIASAADNCCAECPADHAAIIDLQVATAWHISMLLNFLAGGMQLRGNSAAFCKDCMYDFEGMPRIS
jgi:hypothetical protein